MLTILEAIQLSTDYLAKKGIESARTNAELILANILDCTRLKLYLSFDRPLSEEEKNKYRDDIQRRGKFEPLQYITGKTDFYNLEFDITPDVLIPRPETEFLIEAVIAKYGKDENIKILDIGSGSGIISVTLAKIFSNAEIISIDINPAAVECSRRNAEKHQVKGSISFEIMDILSDETEAKLAQFDLIVSNPPYVSLDEYSGLQKEIIEYEPKEAVTDYSDGLTFYKRIISLSAGRLNSGGRLFMEMGKGQAENIRQLFSGDVFDGIEIINDLQKIERIICGRKK